MQNFIRWKFFLNIAEGCVAGGKMRIEWIFPTLVTKVVVFIGSLDYVCPLWEAEWLL